MNKIILNIVLKEFGLTEKDVKKLNSKGKLSKRREYVDARQTYYSLCCEFEDKKSLTRIAKSFRQDHATVLHAKRVVTNRCQTDKLFGATYKRMQDFIRMIVEKPIEYLNSRFNDICKEYIDIFSIKQGLEFHGWVSDIIGDTAMFDDMYLNFRDITWDVNSQQPRNLIIEWYYTCLEKPDEAINYFAYSKLKSEAQCKQE